MKALVLNSPLDLAVRDVPDPGAPGPGEVRVSVRSVGICGSDIHYYEHGRIGDFVLREPMILGHEAAGVVDAVGEGVESLSPGDAVAMEPGVPCGACRECRIGRYNLCKDVRFWATPPHDGVLAEYVLHPAALTFRLPGHLTTEEGALMEPLAVGVHACERGGVRPGCVVAINGAGTIGCVTLMAALAYGASQVIVADVIPARLERARELGAAAVVDARSESLAEAVMSATGGRGGGCWGRMLRPSRWRSDACRCIGARRTCRPGRDGTAADKNRHGGSDGERGGPGYGLSLRQRILNGDRVDRQRTSPGSSTRDGPIPI